MLNMCFIDPTGSIFLYIGNQGNHALKPKRIFLAKAGISTFLRIPVEPKAVRNGFVTIAALNGKWSPLNLWFSKPGSRKPPHLAVFWGNYWRHWRHWRLDLV